jgi:hypothetical protein
LRPPQDPKIKELAEKIASDDAFKGLTSQLQESMAGLVGEQGAPAPVPDPTNFDPSKYMQAMSGMFSNPAFMQMAEQLGQAIISVRRRPSQPGACSSMQALWGQARWRRGGACEADAAYGRPRLVCARARAAGAASFVVRPRGKTPPPFSLRLA